MNSSIFSAPVVHIPIRIVFTTLFWMAGIFGLFNFGEVVKEVAALALPIPTVVAVATVFVQLVGSLLVITNFKQLGWVGAIALAVFTLLTIPVAHAFWTFEEPRRTTEFYVVLEHITVIGGLLLAAITFKRAE